MKSVRAVLFVLLVFSGALADHDEFRGRQKEWLRVHKEWLRLHETGNESARLVVDPRKDFMWIEKSDEVHEGFVAKLPSGLRWYAFHVSQPGIRETSFPVVLTNPREEVTRADQEETLYLVGLGDQCSWSMSFSATRTGTVFTAGAGSKITSVKFQLPLLTNRQSSRFKSFLAPQSPRPVKPQEMIRKQGMSVRVDRVN